MRFFFNNKPVGRTFLQVKTKVKKNLNGLVPGSIVECRHHNKTVVKYEIITKSVDNKKTKGCLAVRFKIKG